MKWTQIMKIILIFYKKVASLIYILMKCTKTLTQTPQLYNCFSSGGYWAQI